LARCREPVTLVPETRIEIAVIIGSMPSADVNNARLAMLPLMLLCWAIAWSFRHVPLPIKNPFLRFPALLIYVVGYGAAAVGQLVVFRSRAGIRGELFRNDNLSFIIVVIGNLVSLWLLFNSVVVQRKKQQGVECNSEKNNSLLRVKS
jgi:hypothetical protein